MAKFCLTKQAKDEIKNALRSGAIDPIKLENMTSEVRNSFLEKYVGKDNAAKVNSLFESKLLLKNKKAGYISWAKNLMGISKQRKMDIISRIEKLDKVLNPIDEKAFLKDLAKQKLGVGVTLEEAKEISDMSNKITEAKPGFDFKADKWTDAEKQIIYATNRTFLQDYVAEKKLAEKEISIKKEPVKKIVDTIVNAPGITKSLQSTFDNSFWGRQGIKVLLNPRTSHIWIKNFIKSFGDIKSELTGVDAIKAAKIDIYSRPNAINGKYEAGNYGLDVLNEEALPSSAPSKIPLFGRLFKASEAAYNGAALRLRADLADRYIRMAENNGLNMSDKNQAKYLGNLVSSITGRGTDGLAKLPPVVSNVFYSVKFLQSNIDRLLAPAKYVARKAGEKVGYGYESKAAEFAGKEDAKNTIAVVGTLTAILTMAKLLNPDSVDEDPRSTNFGKIKIYDRWIDITGGMGALVRLASRLVPTYHNGKWSLWRKSSTGNYTDLLEKGFNKASGIDEVEQFLENKLSPFAGLFRDYWKGEFYGGEKFSWDKVPEKLFAPLYAQSAMEILNNKDEKAEAKLAYLISDGLGFSTQAPIKQKTDWDNSTAKDINVFREKVGEKQFKVANDDYNRVYEWWLKDIETKQSYKSLSDESKQTLKTKAKDRIKQMIFKANNFEYKQSEQEKKETKKQTENIESVLTETKLQSKKKTSKSRMRKL